MTNEQIKLVLIEMLLDREVLAGGIFQNEKEVMEKYGLAKGIDLNGK